MDNVDKKFLALVLGLLAITLMIGLLGVHLYW